MLLLLLSCDAPLGDTEPKSQQPAPSPTRVAPQASFSLDTLAITWKGKQTKVAEGEILLKLVESPLRKAAFDSMGTLGTTILKQPNKLNWMRIKIPATQKLDTTVIDNYRKLPGVLQAQPNFVNTDHAFIPDDLDDQQWALNNTGQAPANGTNDADVDAPEAWDVTTGSSDVIIAILDSGIPMQNGQLSHLDLDDPNKIILGPDYVGDGGGVRDERGHGTHVAGIAGAETDNDDGIAGTCPECRLMIIQLTEPVNGSFFDSDFQDAVMYAVDHNADIINLSVGGPASPTKEDAVEYAQDNNVLLVASAGNDNGGAVVHPAAYASDYSNVIAVSATDHNDEFSTFSSSGPEVSLSAPGGFGGTEDADDIWSTTPDYAVTLGTALDYDYLSGTSMAAPHVAGAAALKLAEDPSLTPGDIKNGLQHTADKVPDMNGAYRTDEFGRGRLNIYEAVRPLDVNITGPGYVDAGQSYNWTANASGGTPSYTYFWYWRSQTTYPNWNYFGTTQLPDQDFTFESSMVPSGQSTAWLRVVVEHQGSGNEEYVYRVIVNNP